MRIAFISDIHANFEALISINDDLARAELVICLGDLVGYYCQVNEVIEYMRSLNSICVLGNHDYFLLEGYPQDALPGVKFGIDYARSVISADNYKWLSKLPLVWGGFIGGISLLISHGSPWNPLDDYLYRNNPVLLSLDAFKYDLVAFGQTHRSLLRYDRKPYLLNPGSIGQSRDIKARACAVFFETTTLQFTKIEYPYDVDVVLDKAFSNGAEKAWITKHLK
jgi:predicted phosphodiesterase